MRRFYRAANSIFGKVGRTASEEVVLHLVKYKFYAYSAVWFWGVESEQISAELPRFCGKPIMMKLFNTGNMQIIKFCCEQLNFILLIAVR